MSPAGHDAATYSDGTKEGFPQQTARALTLRNKWKNPELFADEIVNRERDLNHIPKHRRI